MKKISIITTSRAEFGILEDLIKVLSFDSRFKTELVVTGSHLSSTYGYTVEEIRNCGLTITKEINLNLRSDEDLDICNSMSLCLKKFGLYFQNSNQYLIVILGYRFELLPIENEAVLFNIKIAHINGGEISEGAIDELIRHSITKLSYYHFVGTKEFERRVLQMGESSDRVFNVGDLAISKIRKIKKLTLPEIQNKLNIKLKNKKIILITYHPVTTEKSFNSKYFKDLLKVLSEFNEFQLIFTNPNCDGQNFEIRRLIRKFVSENINSYVFDSLGSEIYLSLLNYCVLVMGNSSSGIIEVPEYRIPTLNIGNRQKVDFMEILLLIVVQNI